MKKTVKIISTILLAIMLVTTVSGTVLAADNKEEDSISGIITNVEKGAKKATSNNDTSKITTVGGNIVNIIQVVGIVVAIVIILIIGIKYLTASAEGKAEYKKTMIPYLVGAALLFAGTSIVKVVYSMVAQLNV